MRRGKVIVTGERTDGTAWDIDVLDLDDESFRLWLLDTLLKANLVHGSHGSSLDLAASDLPIYKQRITPGHPRLKVRT